MRNTVKRFKDNFSGTDNAGSIIIQFNEPNETPSVVNNLAPSDFDKMFMQLNEQVQQEISYESSCNFAYVVWYQN
jgi:hypothetical protein